MDIISLIGEATEYDKKQMLEEKKPKSWCKSISAFANGIGGVLIFGITNEDKVVGLENAECDAEGESQRIDLTHTNFTPNDCKNTKNYEDLCQDTIQSNMAET